MKLYQWDNQYLHNSVVFEVDPLDALPPRTTPTAPPKTTGTQVARWTGSAWEKLSKAPEQLPLPEPDWLPLIATRRYQAEISGITLEGLPIETDDRSKLLINGAAARAARDSNYTLKWKTLEGFVDLPAAQVLIMADAVSDHVQDCFNREAELQAAVADGSITAEMLDQGWPA
ncbi:DUF4376 domain-containing protein [Pseudomonas syringae]|uniref:DUF4376 domain-containing protein n=1 Tax=Pseudomonas syringae CC1417 TaxID=1357272 RepID=A0AAU8LF93_PSESX